MVSGGSQFNSLEYSFYSFLLMKKILITGFTGQVGSQFADFILENTDIEVIGMMRWQEPMDNVYHLADRINKKIE